MDFSHSFYSSIIYVRKREWEGEGIESTCPLHPPPSFLAFSPQTMESEWDLVWKGESE